MNNPTVLPTTSSTLPRAVWVTGGLMLVVIAGLASALVYRAPTDVSGSASPSVLSSAPLAPTDGTDGTDGTSGPNDSSAVPVKPAPAKAPVTQPVTRPLARAPVAAARPAVAACNNCGVIESVQAVQRKGSGTGVGAVAGGVLGGVVGNQMGGGSGKTAMTVLGALGGVVAGNEVEKRTRAETVYDVRVRMDDGTLRTLTLPQAPASRGARVEVDGSAVRVINTNN